MSFTNAHLVVRLNGGFASATAPVDKWSCGFRVGIPTQDIRFDVGAMQTFANTVHAAAKTLHAAANMAVGTNCHFLYATVARVGEDGKYDPAAQLTTVSTGTSQAGAGVPSQPWNTAHSFGLRTASPRGYASNGRVYYPMLNATVAANTGRLGATQQGQRVNEFVTFLRAVNTAAAVYDLGSLVCVMSNVGTGTTRACTAVRADERLDSIERRENDLPPSYVTVNI